MFGQHRERLPLLVCSSGCVIAGVLSPDGLWLCLACPFSSGLQWGVGLVSPELALSPGLFVVSALGSLGFVGVPCWRWHMSGCHCGGRVCGAGGVLWTGWSLHVVCLP